MPTCFQPTYLLPPHNNSTFSFEVVQILEAINDFYSSIRLHVFYSLTLMSFVLNFAILIVLSHKQMRKLGVNVMMMSIAFCDFGCALFAGIHLVLEHIGRRLEYVNCMYVRFSMSIEESWHFAIFLVIYDYLTIGFHSSSIFLGVGMALCRIMSLNLSNKNR
uniref:G_PROTEIN_RECEP_F1_2 domain-containing protein n=1 Tax=Caenorhabditis japonica TaxID=281687 RepID=A0A8R1IA10_CAEJA